MRKNAFIFTMLMVASSLSAQYQLPKLAYSYSALEPYIDSATMYIHYNNHHGAYTKNLNDALAKYPELQKKPINELFANMDQIPEDIETSVSNNGGGYWNHEFFWNCMSPSKTQPSIALSKAITENFGSFENFKKEFSSAASTVFGSGWAWLIVTDSGKLKIVKTANQDNPLMDVVADKGTPILAIDVWEHAYYLKNKNVRSAYIENFWQVINWQFVSEKYADAVKK